MNNDLIRCGYLLGTGVALGAAAYLLLRHQEKQEQALLEELRKPQPLWDALPVDSVDTSKAIKEEKAKSSQPIEVTEDEEVLAQIEASQLPEDLPVTPLADEFPLRLGSKGHRVERLQIWLMKNYGWFGQISGVFDKPTEKKLVKHLGRSSIDQAFYDTHQMNAHVSEQLAV